MILPLKVKLFLNTVKVGIASGSLPRGQLIQVKLLLSLLSFFRACSPSFRKVSWDSIVKPNSGEGTLNVGELKAALKSLGITTLLVGKPSIFYASSKAGPNFPVATIGLGLDLIGWILRPRKWYEYCLICYTNGYYVCLTQFLFFSILVAPIALFCLLVGIKPLLGHIAVLSEARGKMRKIGITDFWTQILFRPLHDAIYAKLANIPNDGTNNQAGPIVRMLGALNLVVPSKGISAPALDEIVINGITINLITKAGIEKLPLPLQDIVRKSLPSIVSAQGVDSYTDRPRPKLALKGKVQTVQSLDLTAATDRLPVDLQAQILTILGYPGELWKSVLEREWNSSAGPIRYAVGQPMGAYSSFAMLALTNHVLVHMAMNRVSSYKVPYCILGDDVAIASKKVSKLYRDLLTQLGVEVNPIKGFDGGIMEFAKQL
jgi:hypothetical protein